MGIRISSVIPAVPHHWHVYTAVLSRHVPQECVRVRPDVLRRSQNSPCRPERVKRNRNRTANQREYARRRPCALGRMGDSPDVVLVLSGFEYVAFSGGPLAKNTGDTLVAAGVKPSSLYGATEVSVITCAFKSLAELALWDWVRFGPNQRVRWVAQGDGTYECQAPVRLSQRRRSVT
ncbi:hypothetical protein JVT61DRAFT_3458 [Boletus reticuloceps]|uniref:AMP-dependent synthetase/ligase domain-containing protein n=1 Tax=Boletus reticuloceps TaxID=495285 RepID=A0A8I2YPM8_9AGAM|nr:hypothetical protein JVT61DRAFT_3458 [Boletus reticuloceps]